MAIAIEGKPVLPDTNMDRCQTTAAIYVLYPICPLLTSKEAERCYLHVRSWWALTVWISHSGEYPCSLTNGMQLALINLFKHYAYNSYLMKTFNVFYLLSLFSGFRICLYSLNKNNLLVYYLVDCSKSWKTNLFHRFHSTENWSGCSGSWDNWTTFSATHN